MKCKIGLNLLNESLAVREKKLISQNHTQLKMGTPTSDMLYASDIIPIR